MIIVASLFTVLSDGSGTVLSDGSGNKNVSVGFGGITTCDFKSGKSSRLEFPPLF